jgi:LPS sulfotransferase NodH
MNKFILLSLKRSGSTYLVSALNSHPDIKCAGEIFKAINPLRIIYPGFSYSKTKNENFKSKALHYFNRSKIVNDHLNKIYAQNTDTIFGFKLMPRQITRFPTTKTYIIKNNIPVILLIREHYLERLVSIKVASETKVFASKNTSNKINKITLNSQSIVHEIELMEKQSIEMKNLANQTKNIKISYEELTVTAIEESQKSIFNFLGVEHNNMEGATKKLIKNPLYDVIENYNEIRKVLLASKYKYLIND